MWNLEEHLSQYIWEKARLWASVRSDRHEHLAMKLAVGVDLYVERDRLHVIHKRYPDGIIKVTDDAVCKTSHPLHSCYFMAEVGTSAI